MHQYLALMQDVIDNGTSREDRTGTGVMSVFGRQMRFDLQKGFPLVTTKKIYLRSIILELIWFLSGSTNISWLKENNCSIWDPWADKDGELGPVYGHQWRSWPTAEGGSIDQISHVLNLIKTNPTSRRMLVVAWNPGDVSKMALPPCHCMFQFFVADGKLSCQLYQRSCDVFIGLPFNIASYALLTHMIAEDAGLEVGEFIWSGGDVHLYSNHLDLAHTQLQRAPKSLPQLKLNPAKDIFSYKLEDFEIQNYDHHPHIKAVIAV